MPITYTVIRCEVFINSRENFFDIYLGKAPEAWNSTDVVFQIAFFKGTKKDPIIVTAEELAEVSEITLSVKASDRTGAAFMEKSVPYADFNTALTLEQWSAADGQHFSIPFSYSENNLVIEAGKKSGTYFLVIHGTSSTDPLRRPTFGATTYTVIEDGVTEPVGPVQAGNIIPADSEYDDVGVFILNVPQDKGFSWAKGANDDSLDNPDEFGEEITVSGSYFITAGTQVILYGTPNQVVTAVIRPGVFLTVEQADGRYQERSERNLVSGYPGIDAKGVLTVPNFAADPEAGSTYGFYLSTTLGPSFIANTTKKRLAVQTEPILTQRIDANDELQFRRWNGAGWDSIAGYFDTGFEIAAVFRLPSLTESKLLCLDGSNIVSAVAGVTLAEVGYLAGVTSELQTQLNARLVKASNLSDLANLATARTNLSVYSKAEVNVAVNATYAKGQCVVATTEDLVLEDLLTVDGVELAVGDRVLVKAQTDPKQNGIWIVAEANWTRAFDFDDGDDIANGAMVYVILGATFNRQIFYLLSHRAVPGVDDIIFS